MVNRRFESGRGGSVFVFGAVQSSPWRSQRCTPTLTCYVCIWAEPRSRFPTPPAAQTRSECTQSRRRSTRGATWKDGTDVYRTTFDLRKADMRVYCMRYQNTPCWEAVPLPPTPGCEVNLSCIRVHDLPMLCSYLPLESFYGNIMTCLIWSAVRQLSYFSLPICLSDPDVYVWGAEVSMWETPLQSACTCYTDAADGVSARLVWFCKNFGNKHHLAFVFGLPKSLKGTPKTNTSDWSSAKMLNFLDAEEGKKKKKKITEFFSCSCSEASEESSKTRRLCYFAIFSAGCAKEMCQQMQWV